MIPVTAYKSFDGVLFENAKECSYHESLIIDIAKIVDKIPKFKHTDEYRLGQVSFKHMIDIQPIVREFLEYVGCKTGKDLVNMTNEEITKEIFKFNRQPVTFAWTNYIGCIDKENRQWYSITYCKDFFDRTE